MPRSDDEALDELSKGVDHEVVVPGSGTSIRNAAPSMSPVSTRPDTVDARVLSARSGRREEHENAGSEAWSGRQAGRLRVPRILTLALYDSAGPVSSDDTANRKGTPQGDCVAAEAEIDMELRDKVAIVTGGKRIGRVVARALADRGMDLVLSYRGSRLEAEETAADVVAAGRRATIVAADVSMPQGCATIVAHATATFGRLDVLVNMASVYRAKPLEQLTAEYWDGDLNVNLRPAFLCALAAVPALRAAGGGRIVNFSDWLARSGRPAYKGFTAYYTAKAGVVALTESLALELAPQQILVNAIAPGPILPPPDMSAAEIAEVAAATPVGRWGGEVEIVKAVLFLCETDFVTGETIRVDGGRHLA